jgi:hypothetical protein
MKKIKQAKSKENLCEAINDLNFDVRPDHEPNPLWIMDGGSACVECGGFIPDNWNSEVQQ